MKIIGLTFKTETSANGKLVYIKIYTPFRTLLRIAEEIKMKLPVEGFSKEEFEYEHCQLDCVLKMDNFRSEKNSLINVFGSLLVKKKGRLFSVDSSDKPNNDLRQVFNSMTQNKKIIKGTISPFLFKLLSPIELNQEVVCM